MVESFLCVDCKTIDRFAKICDICRVKICVCSHNLLDRCNLLHSIRELKSKLPVVNQEEKLRLQESDLQAFIQKNSEQKAEVDDQIKSLIKSLEERRTELLHKFDEYDQLAKEHIQLFDQVRNIARTVDEFKSTIAQITTEQVTCAQTTVDRQTATVEKAADALSKLVPDPLGTLFMQRMEREINHLGCQLTRRRAGHGEESEEIWIGTGPFQECDTHLDKGDDVKDDPDYVPLLIMFHASDEDEDENSEDTDEEDEYTDTDEDEPKAKNDGRELDWELKSKIIRHKGGRYEFMVVDGNNEVLKKVEWNNYTEDAMRMTLHHYCDHLAWNVGRSFPELREFAFQSSDQDLMCTLGNVLEHACFVDATSKELLGEAADP